jgi:RluA family pseudouridine synthase
VEHAVGCYLKTIGASDTVMIVHRLDRGTSGVMFFPKHKAAAAQISKMLQQGTVDKVYWALVDAPAPADHWVVDLPIAKIGSARYGVHTPGKEARTEFSVVAANDSGTLLAAHPITGRTHQIRVHLAHCGLPIVGDKTYGGSSYSRMMLHCRSMTFNNANGKPIQAIADADPRFMAELNHRQLLPAALSGR